MAEFRWDDHWWTRTCLVPLVDRQIDVSIFPEDFRNASPSERQLEAFASALKLSPTLHDLLDAAAERYREEVDEAVGLTWPEVAGINRQNIRAHYRIDRIFVPRLRSSKRSFLFLEGECDWEEEHGIEFLLRDGQVIQCGPQEGLMQNEEWDDFIADSA